MAKPTQGSTGETIPGYGAYAPLKRQAVSSELETIKERAARIEKENTKKMIEASLKNAKKDEIVLDPRRRQSTDHENP